MSGKSNEKLRAVCKSNWELAQRVTHNAGATELEAWLTAQVTVVLVRSLQRIAAALEAWPTGPVTATFAVCSRRFDRSAEGHAVEAVGGCVVHPKERQAEFEALATKVLDSETAVDWSAPRLLCIAGDFTRYDEHAVEQINRSIELVRYRQYGSELLLFELVNAPGGTDTAPAPSSGGTASEKTVGDYLAQAPPVMVERYQTLEEFALSLGDDVTKKALKNYFAFRRLKNFVCVEVHPGGGHLLVYVKVNPNEVELVDGVLRDVRDIGHFGTGGLEVRVTADEHVEIAKEMIARSYEVSWRAAQPSGSPDSRHE